MAAPSVAPLPFSPAELGITPTVQNTFLAFDSSSEVEARASSQRRSQSAPVEVWRVDHEDHPGSASVRFVHKNPSQMRHLEQGCVQQEAFAPSSASTNNGTADVQGRAPSQEHGRLSDGVTTMMIRQIPRIYTQEVLKEELDAEGFLGRYNFLYLPQDVKRSRCRGYAFINLVDQGLANFFCQRYHGRCLQQGRAQKPLLVSPADIQGLGALTMHFASQHPPEGLPEGIVLPLFLPVATMQTPAAGYSHALFQRFEPHGSS